MVDLNVRRFSTGLGDKPSTTWYSAEAKKQSVTPSNHQSDECRPYIKKYENVRWPREK